MKETYSIAIACLLMLGAVLLPRHAYAAVCQNKTVIVYSNGMFNDAEAANASKKELMKKLIISSQVYADQTKYDYKLAYASDGSQFVPQVGGTGAITKLINAALALPNTAGQVAEVVWQDVRRQVPGFRRFTRRLRRARIRPPIYMTRTCRIMSRCTNPF